MKAVKPEGFPTDWNSSPIWSMYRRVSRRHDGNEPHLSVYRDLGVVSREGRTDNWNRISEDTSGYQLVLPGDLVVNKMKAWQGSMGVSMLRGVVSPAYFVYEPLHQMDHRFIHHLLRSKPFIDAYGRMSKGIRVGQWDLDPWAFSRVPVSLPPVSDQVRISEQLESNLQDLDAVIEKQRALVDGLRRRRVRTVLSAVTAGVRAGYDMVPSGIHWSAEVPSAWSVMPLKRVFSSVQPGVWGEEPDGGEDDILCVRVADFDRPRLRVGDSVETIRKVSAGDRRAKMLQRGDLLIEKSGGTGINPVGFVAIYDREAEAVCANFIARMRVNDDQDSRFWMYALHASYASGLTWNYVKQTTGIQNLDLNALLSERFPVPPPEEQREIAAHMDRETARIDALIARSERLIELSQERRAALITAAVTGQIEVTTAIKALEVAA